MYVKIVNNWNIEPTLSSWPKYYRPIELVIKALKSQLETIMKVNDLPDKCHNRHGVLIDNPYKQRLLRAYHEGIDTRESHLLADIILLRTRLSQRKLVNIGELHNRALANCIDEDMLKISL